MATGGFHRKKETQTEREANDKVPLLPPPPQFRHTSPSHFPPLISNQCSQVPGMRARGWIVGIC